MSVVVKRYIIQVYSSYNGATVDSYDGGLIDVYGGGGCDGCNDVSCGDGTFSTFEMLTLLFLGQLPSIVTSSEPKANVERKDKPYRKRFVTHHKQNIPNYFKIHELCIENELCTYCYRLMHRFDVAWLLH